MKLLNIETPVTGNFIPRIPLNVQDFYFHKVGYTSYDEGIFGPYTEHSVQYFLNESFFFLSAAENRRFLTA
jgi:hypothetical protein